MKKIMMSMVVFALVVPVAFLATACFGGQGYYRHINVLTPDNTVVTMPGEDEPRTNIVGNFTIQNTSTNLIIVLDAEIEVRATSVRELGGEGLRHEVIFRYTQKSIAMQANSERNITFDLHIQDDRVLYSDNYGGGYFFPDEDYIIVVTANVTIREVI